MQVFAKNNNCAINIIDECLKKFLNKTSAERETATALRTKGLKYIMKTE